jgi:hypothetical protein
MNMTQLLDHEGPANADAFTAELWQQVYTQVLHTRAATYACAVVPPM